MNDYDDIVDLTITSLGHVSYISGHTTRRHKQPLGFAPQRTKTQSKAVKTNSLSKHKTNTKKR